MLQTALQVRFPLLTGPGRVGGPCCGKRAPLPLSQGDIPEQDCPFLARNSPPLVYFVGGCRVANPSVVASCLIQRLLAAKQALPLLSSWFQSRVKSLHHTQAPENPLGRRLLCCCAKHCPGCHIYPASENFL